MADEGKDEVEARSSPAPAVQPTASLLVFLFADRVLPEAPLVRAWTVYRRTIVVPGTESRVNAIELAGRLSAVSIWNLRRQGAVALALETGTDWTRLRRTKLTIELVDDLATVGLEGSLLRRLARLGRGQHRVDDIAPRWVECIRGCGREGADEGLLRREGRRDTQWTMIDPDRVAALEPRFAKELAEWERFVAEEPELHEAVVDRCHHELVES